jgi:hypothetical protein
LPFNALVVRVMIASPGDTAAYRTVVRETLEDWNSLHAESTGVMLLPVLWERDATPEMGDRAQAIINKQLVDAADVLVGVFWTRLGTPTGEAASGTAEEVERFVASGRRVHLYFSTEPVALEIVDQEQVGKLKEFREELAKHGLIDQFQTNEELRRKVFAALTKTVRDQFGQTVEDDPEQDERSISQGASLLARIEREREISAVTKSGRPRYRTRERLIVENRGTSAAENVSVTFEVPDDDDARAVPTLLADDAPVARLPPGGTVEFPMASFLGMAAQWDVVFRWSEAGIDYEDRQTLR